LPSRIGLQLKGEESYLTTDAKEGEPMAKNCQAFGKIGGLKEDVNHHDGWSGDGQRPGNGPGDREHDFRHCK